MVLVERWCSKISPRSSGASDSVPLACLLEEQVFSEAASYRVSRNEPGDCAGAVRIIVQTDLFSTTHLVLASPPVVALRLTESDSVSILLVTVATKHNGCDFGTRATVINRICATRSKLLQTSFIQSMRTEY